MFTDKTQVALYNARAPFDDTTPPPYTKGIGNLIHESPNVLKAVYDFSVLGGAIGSVNLVDDLGNAAKLPLGAIITRTFIDVITAPTSGGSATVALTAQTAGDLKAALAIASLTGLVEGLQTGAISAAVKLTADRQLLATIATAALTAGKFNLFVHYVLGN